MKYFAKYLPVDGGFRRSVKSEEGIPVDYEYEVKLFLCTRDIKNGDEYYTAPDYMVKRICNDDSYSFEHCVKIIGKISDSAIWINEGDEFESDELLQQGTGVNIIPNKNSIIQIKCKCCNTFK